MRLVLQPVLTPVPVPSGTRNAIAPCGRSHDHDGAHTYKHHGEIKVPLFSTPCHSPDCASDIFFKASTAVVKLCLQSPFEMPGPCKYCLAVLGLCFVSCRCKAESHEHLDVATEAGGETDFVAFLGAESPAEHVKHLYNESSVSESIFSWMVDASRCAGGCGCMWCGLWQLCASEQPRALRLQHEQMQSESASPECCMHSIRAMSVCARMAAACDIGRNSEFVCVCSAALAAALPTQNPQLNAPPHSTDP